MQEDRALCRQPHPTGARAAAARLLLGSLVIVFAGCGPHKPAAAPSRIPGHPSPSASVRDVPWKDQVYDFGDGETYRFADGRYAQLDEAGNCTVCQAILAVSYGDVDRDGSEEAIVLTNTNLGGAAHVTQAYVFELEQGSPRVIAEIEGGDRGEGGLEAVSVEGGQVVVRRFNSLPEDGACCPSQVLVEHWRWVDGRLVQQAGPPQVEQRERKRWSLPR